MTPLYLRLLDLCEAAGIRTLIGIPDPAFLALMVAAEALPLALKVWLPPSA